MMIFQGVDISRYVTITKRETKDAGGYFFVSHHPEFPTVISQGETPEEAERNLEEATKMAIAHLHSNKLPVPIPMIIEREFAYCYQIV
jgi:predicted RNase H-like HicB family nuclease